MLSSKIKRKMKKTLNLLFLLLAVFAISSCSSDDDEKKEVHPTFRVIRQS